MRAAIAVVMIFAACAGEEPEPAAAPVPTTRPAALAPPAAAPPEDEYVPAEAQALAEAVVNADFNRNKKTGLVMRMTTIVGRTSSLSGFSTAVAAREDKLDDRLSRLSARVTETEVIIQLSGAILFDFDSATIRPDAERALEDVRQVVASYTGRPVRIDGHTDSVAGDEYNRQLSEKRARSVAQWLTSRGVEQSRITTAGLGESKPAATNDTSEGRQKNRRVEIVIARK